MSGRGLLTVQPGQNCDEEKAEENRETEESSNTYPVPAFRPKQTPFLKKGLSYCGLVRIDSRLRCTEISEQRFVVGIYGVSPIPMEI